MPTPRHARGALLEEAVLALLRASGYETVEVCGSDPTLTQVGAGLCVRGRGAEHQIDAIADYRYGHPFGNRQRLLVEAKFYDQHPTSLPVVRNTVGVIKDVSEFWVPGRPGRPLRRRYHYQAAIFSATRFTSDAERYAYAHDVFLLPLEGNRFLRTLLDAIREHVTNLDASGALAKLGLDAIRQALRLAIRGNGAPHESTSLPQVAEAYHSIGQALIGNAGRSFPLFLVPRDREVVRQLQSLEFVSIDTDESGWYLAKAGRRILSFDLPPELFRLYSEDGSLSRSQAVGMKLEHLNEIHALTDDGGTPRLITFRLEPGWVERVESKLAPRV